MDSTTPPSVSVVVTCYNYGKYLEGCLNSVLKQTYKNIEIIVIDDGSTDNTADVIKTFRDVPNINYIYQNNSGQAHAKNVGIQSSTGELVAFLDADDQWLPEKLENQIACFSNPDVGVVYCRARYIDENNLEFEYDMTAKYLQPRRGNVTEWLIFDNFVQFSSSIVRRECFIKFGMFDESLKMGIDWDLWLRLSTKYDFDFVDERHFFYRMGHSGQMSKDIEERFRCANQIMNNFLRKHQGHCTRWAVRKARAVTCCGRGEYYRSINRIKSTSYFLGAIRHNPAEMCAYKGLIKNVILW